MKNKTTTKQPASRQKSTARRLGSGQEAEPTLDELERQLELAGRVDALLAKTAEPEKPVFTISREDGHSITACTRGDERQALQWQFNVLHRALAAGRTGDEAGTLPLGAAAATLLSEKPRSPVEALLINQILISHTMSAEFAARAGNANDNLIASKLAERARSFMEITCRQMETLLKLRGEGGSQRVIVP